MPQQGRKKKPPEISPPSEPYPQNPYKLDKTVLLFENGGRVIIKADNGAPLYL
jgi:hypothetical protein